MNTPVAIIDAVPGWHAVILVKTGLKPAGEGKEYLKVLVFPIKQWGFRAPTSLLRVADRRGGLPFDSLAELFAPLGSWSVTRGPEMLPLDPRSEEPAFFDDEELIGVFPPRAGDAQDVLKKTKDLLDEETKKRVDQERAVKERVQQEAERDIEVSVKGVKATAESRNLKSDKPFRDPQGDWVCRFPWSEDPEHFRGSEADVRTHLQVQIAAHVMMEREDG